MDHLSQNHNPTTISPTDQQHLEIDVDDNLRLTSQEENTLKSALAFVVLRRRIKARNNNNDNKKTTNNRNHKSKTRNSSISRKRRQEYGDGNDGQAEVVLEGGEYNTTGIQVTPSTSGKNSSSTLSSTMGEGGKEGISKYGDNDGHGKETFSSRSQLPFKKRPRGNNRHDDESDNKDNDGLKNDYDHDDEENTLPFLRNSSLFLQSKNSKTVQPSGKCYQGGLTHPRRNHIAGMIQVGLSIVLPLYADCLVYDRESSCDGDMEREEVKEHQARRQSSINGSAYDSGNGGNNSRPCLVYDYKTASHPKPQLLRAQARTTTRTTNDEGDTDYDDGSTILKQLDHRRQDRMSSSYAVLDGIASHLASHLRSLYCHQYQHPYLSSEADDDNDSDNDNDREQKLAHNRRRDGSVLAQLHHHFFQPMLAPLRINRRRRKRKTRTIDNNPVNIDDNVSDNNRCHCHHHHHSRTKSCAVAMTKDDPVASTLWRRKNGRRMEGCEDRHIQMVLAMCTILHRIVHFDCMAVGDEVMKGICDVLKCLYYHREGSGIGGGSRTDSNRHSHHNTVKPLSESARGSGGYDGKVMINPCDNDSNGPVSSENNNNETTTSLPLSAAAEGGERVQRNAGKGEGYLDNGSSKLAMEEGDSGEDEEEEVDDEWLEGDNCEFNSRENNANRSGCVRRAKVLWIQYPNILAVNCIQLLEEIIKLRLLSSTTTASGISSLSVSTPFPSSSLLLSSSSILAPSSEEVYCQGNNIKSDNEEYCQGNDIKRQHQQREQQCEVNDILSTLNAELGSELMVPVLSKDMASFYMMEHNKNGGSKTISSQKRIINRRECYDDNENADEKVEDSITKFYGLNSGAKLMVRLCVYDLIQKLSL